MKYKYVAIVNIVMMPNTVEAKLKVRNMSFAFRFKDANRITACMTAYDIDRTTTAKVLYPRLR